MKIVKDYIDELLNDKPTATYVRFIVNSNVKCLKIQDFINTYGDRKMCEDPFNVFCDDDGLINYHQFIHTIY